MYVATRDTAAPDRTDLALEGGQLPWPAVEVRPALQRLEQRGRGVACAGAVPFGGPGGVGWDY